MALEIETTDILRTFYTMTFQNVQQSFIPQGLNYNIIIHV